MSKTKDYGEKYWVKYYAQKLSRIVLGHIASEEPGTEFMANWLKEKLRNIKTTHILSNNSLSFL
ncbi:hypothetical protein [Mucilaginibacter lappiensis]|uniref:NIF3 family GTP cyclohydrolase 1 type 2 n=1 Tax=Mucilaginibacter lappiensis TaxID=354630 RepID=A0A1N7AKI4_9SPHI|nr:hypothetical protein [Mucilaginibacter lappiensis]MBB6110506.1 putative NIF3 family GTP cyclohydrolase 1 type 2 [Mucilaginibacter lappiensis]MBB6131802.1 putative NIF3 family GTP cyclohydrolase 1 type 2 [Mucilaginibacter lappiensis]SIR39531.1 hypothetical protein SAMN05421821_10727 [Mucilaginibacter lappiensis]